MVEHPGAQDTLEGIAQWWLLEQDLRFKIEYVSEAVAELVARELLLERRMPDSRIHYRINPAKQEDVALFLKSRSPDQTSQQTPIDRRLELTVLGLRARRERLDREKIR